MTSAIAASRAFADFGAAGAASIAGTAAGCAAGTGAGGRSRLLFGQGGQRHARLDQPGNARQAHRLGRLCGGYCHCHRLCSGLSHGLHGRCAALAAAGAVTAAAAAFGAACAAQLCGDGCVVIQCFHQMGRICRGLAPGQAAVIFQQDSLIGAAQQADSLCLCVHVLGGQQLHRPSARTAGLNAAGCTVWPCIPITAAQAG